MWPVLSWQHKGSSWKRNQCGLIWVSLLALLPVLNDSGSFTPPHSAPSSLLSFPPLVPGPLIQTAVCPSRPGLGQHEQWHSPLWASVTHLRMDLYLQHRTRKQLVNPFSLRPLICSYLLQQPKKSQGIFSSLLPIDPALRKSALLSKHYWSLPLDGRLSHQCIKGLDELKFHFRQLVPVIFTLFSIVGNMRWRAATHKESIGGRLREEKSVETVQITPTRSYYHNTIDRFTPHGLSQGRHPPLLRFQ